VCVYLPFSLAHVLCFSLGVSIICLLSLSLALFLFFKLFCSWSFALLINPAPTLTGGVVNGQFLDFVRKECRWAGVLTILTGDCQGEVICVYCDIESRGDVTPGHVRWARDLWKDLAWSDISLKKTFCLMNIRPQDFLSHEPTLWFRRH